ncbi:MAG: porphobilinogen synthase [Candidatus Margulisbacteria bacterium]|nr:porphobilinogen synthase [Candidatus Margulisiibacteriota bacterium]
MNYPEMRLQRLRQNPSIRKMVKEHHLRADQFIMPIFIDEGITQPSKIDALPGIMKHGLNSLNEEVKEIAESGIISVILFGIPKEKSETGNNAYSDDGIIQKAIRQIKHAFPNVVVITDCCLCEYTTHGHCGILKNNSTSDTFDSEATLTILGKIAVSYAKAGADIVAPSGMIDGMVISIRDALDEQGYEMTSILSYAAKFASQFYGPFRDATNAHHFNGSRDHHQMGVSQGKEAIREVLMDESEGADMVMVKPGLPYLDVVRIVSEQSQLPVAIYQVSGEYAMLKLAAEKGIVDEVSAFEEVFLSMKRAGASLIISYYAKEMAGYIRENL